MSYATTAALAAQNSQAQLANAGIVGQALAAGLPKEFQYLQPSLRTNVTRTTTNIIDAPAFYRNDVAFIKNPDLDPFGMSDLEAESRSEEECFHGSNSGPPANNHTSFQEDQTRSCLDELSVNVPGLALEPLSGTEILSRVKGRCHDVSKRYIPCVDFLVSCQQELRRGLAQATQKRQNRRSRGFMSPERFFNAYIAVLPDQFLQKNQFVMDDKNLSAAYDEIKKLCGDARAVERHGSESMKNTFLGGMKDGESWGLRKWLSKNGGALKICTELECILNACQKVDRSDPSLKKLAEILRPLTKGKLDELRRQVPPTYQEISNAHPYLPFFHRLEASLRSMANFDPDDDDVICIDDDDEIEELKAKASTTIQNKKRSKSSPGNPQKRQKTGKDHTNSTASADAGTNDDSEEDSVIEVVAVKPSKNIKQDPNGWKDLHDLQNLLHFDDVLKNGLETFDTSIFGGQKLSVPRLPTESAASPSQPFEMAREIDRLAHIFDLNQQSTVRPLDAPFIEFWDGERFASALRLFANILRFPESMRYVDRIDQQQFSSTLPYDSVIKNPLCFRDIFSALIESNMNENDSASSCVGRLPADGLDFWNMWKGKDFLQAIDLVLLNCLAYSKASNQGRSPLRSETNRVRRKLWEGINEIIAKHIGNDLELRRQLAPTKRGESSGFVILK